jgi:hypothetical protein
VGISQYTYFNPVAMYDYRKKHMIFDTGKALLGMPIAPTNVNGLTMMILRPVEQAWPWAVDHHSGLDLKEAMITDLKHPLDADTIGNIEMVRLGIKPDRSASNGQDEPIDVVDKMNTEENVQALVEAGRGAIIR